MIVIYPLNDLKPHDEESSVCECEPEVFFDEEGDMVIVHNAFDGREKYEE